MTRHRLGFSIVCAMIAAAIIHLSQQQQPFRWSCEPHVFSVEPDKSGLYLYGGLAACLTVWMVWTIALRRRNRIRHRCRKCGYDLRGLAKMNVCPECGEVRA
jgi:hypothetical protein